MAEEKCDPDSVIRGLHARTTPNVYPQSYGHCREGISFVTVVCEQFSLERAPSNIQIRHMVSQYETRVSEHITGPLVRDIIHPKSTQRAQAHKESMAE